MKETKGVVEYITRVETVANQLSRNEETLPASRIVENMAIMKGMLLGQVFQL